MLFSFYVINIDFSEIVFKEDKDKNLKDIKAKVNARKREVLTFANLKDLKLKDLNLVDSDFRFADLRNSDLSNSNISYSLLAGTIFKNSNLENADLSYSVLNEAIFENANCRNTKFNKIIGYAGLEYKDYWDMVGYYPLNFINTDLQYADFSGADIRGANFKGANFKDTVFNKTQISYLELTNEQKQNVIVKED